ncbi:LamG-like jellyroll fold domain-containing protein [Streptomyces sp. NBC_00582]|uniref:LamG-like jellyroll fold domain-containing protein n=1 Tax=Streptomyces sp. NBC_00582 TaxID=2975783 RepID=UPI002E7FE884|nr:LamG-like jellyroll fold domain-containing protein [Streptomyces sp. NBC_00582]WUB61545.1 LamG domain-containing protein [Streptomyces sp. NBC_00582]
MPVLVEMGWGGQVLEPDTITWTDISTFADDQVTGVTITRGASDELSETQPGNATLRLDNTDGRFTPGNTGSPYYPYVERNAPIRISMAVMPTLSGSAPYPLAQLGDDFDDGRVNTAVWTTNTGGAGVETSEGRLRITLAPGVDTNFTSVRQWTLTSSKVTAKLCAVPALNGSSNCAASMWVLSTTSGTRIGWRYDASTGVLAAMSQVGFSDGTPTNLTYNAIDHAWLRVRESGGTVYWETSSDGYVWTSRRTLATPAWVTSQQVALDFPTTRTGGTSGYIEWDLVGADVRPRFYGLVNEFPVDWKGLTSHVTISCTDLFKRLNKLPVLRSMVAEEIIPLGPVAYYPLTEPADSTTVGDLSGNGLASMAITQAGSGGTLTMAADSGPAETGDSTPTFTPSSSTNGKYFAVDMGPFAQAQLTANRVAFEAWFKTTTTGRAIVSLYSADLQYVHLLSLSGSGAMQVEWTATGSTLAVETVASTSGLNDGAWHHVVYDMHLSGSVWIDGVLVDASLAAVTVGQDQSLLQVGGYRGTRLWDGSLCHVAVFGSSGAIGSAMALHYNAGVTGFAGEDADDRIGRLAGYASIIEVNIEGTTHDPIASQGPGGTQVVTRMREVESTESGKLFASRDTFGLTYQSRDVRYNPDSASEAFTIAYADTETGDVSLADDDQKQVNDVEATRPGGATQRVTSASSILAHGTYPKSLSILKTTDNSVLDAANWLVSRYEDPGPELREVPIEAFTMSNYLAILGADISDYFSVNSLPSQAPASTLRVTVEGYQEVLKYRSHRIQFHTSASVTDSVWVLDDTTYSVLGSTTRLAY